MAPPSRSSAAGNHSAGIPCRRWLEPFPWEELGRLQTGAIEDSMTALLEETWNKARAESLSLLEAVELCRHCHTIFAGCGHGSDQSAFPVVVRNMLRPVTQGMSPALAETVMAIACEYVTGAAPKPEFKRALNLIRAHYPA